MAVPNSTLSDLIKRVRLPSYGQMQTFSVQPSEYDNATGTAMVSPQVLSRMGITPQGTGSQSLRQAAEAAGGVVRWQGAGQPINVTTGSRILDMARQAASALGDLAQRNRPTNIPVGTPTLAARQLAEQQRQFDEEQKYRYAALAQQATLARANAAGGGSLADLLGKTAGERQNIFTSQAYAAALNHLRQGSQYAGWLKDKTGQQLDPLEATINYIFTDPEMSQMGTLGGADLPYIADRITGEVLGTDFLTYAKQESANISQQMATLPDGSAEKDSLYQRLFALQKMQSVYSAIRIRQSNQASNMSQPLQ